MIVMVIGVQASTREKVSRVLLFVVDFRGFYQLQSAFQALSQLNYMSRERSRGGGFLGANRKK